MFHEVKQKFGERLRLLLTGGAPIAPHTEAFLKVCSGAGVAQGYGLTETCAAIFVTAPDDPDMDTTTGVPLAYVQFCLESVPDMNYNATGDGPIGEVCVRAPYNFTGYYKAEDLTSEVLDADGWFHTGPVIHECLCSMFVCSGDIGTITPEGALKLVDRKKNILKLSQGEYIAVEKIEGIYKELMAVDQIWVHGDALKHYLVAVVVPSEAYVKTWAQDKNKTNNYKALCKDPDLVMYIQEVMDGHAKAHRLKGYTYLRDAMQCLVIAGRFETVRRLHLESVQFSPMNALLTPTFKMKRPQLRQKYEDVVCKLYNMT